MVIGYNLVNFIELVEVVPTVRLSALRHFRHCMPSQMHFNRVAWPKDGCIVSIVAYTTFNRVPN